MPRRTRGRPPHDDILTPAEWRVLHAVQHGFSNRALAARLGVSHDAIKYHLRNLCDKLGVRHKHQLRTRFVRPKRSSIQQPSLSPPPAQESTMSASPHALGPLGQISRTVGNIDVSRHWYEQVLGLPHLFTFGTLSFFDCQGTRLMLSQKEHVNADESILYFKVTDIVSTVETLQSKGVEIIAAPHRIHKHEDGTEEWMAFFKDPDGRPLALMSQVK